MNNNEQTVILSEGVLNDDVLLFTDNGVIIRYYLYLNEWANSKYEIEFASYEQAVDWYADKFKARAIDQGRYYIESDPDQTDQHGQPLEPVDDERAIYEWRSLTDCLAYC